MVGALEGCDDLEGGEWVFPFFGSGIDGYEDSMDDCGLASYEINDFPWLEEINSNENSKFTL